MTMSASVSRIRKATSDGLLALTWAVVTSMPVREFTADAMASHFVFVLLASVISPNVSNRLDENFVL